MYGLSLSQAMAEVKAVGWETLRDVALLRNVEAAYRAVVSTKDESTLPDDPVTRMVADLYAEQLREELHARQRSRGAGEAT